jgi:hypothetical protein
LARAYNFNCFLFRNLRISPEGVKVFIRIPGNAADSLYYKKKKVKLSLCSP